VYIVMSLKFCDCNNILTSVVTAAAKYHMCTVCAKRFDFEDGDTLIRAPAVKPTGRSKYEHILRDMDKVGLMPITRDKECPKCKKYISRYAILDNTTWYKCIFDDCRELYN
jgi:hypothetical protein